MEDFRLKVFLTVAQTGSFTRAARLLGVSQPAVSQHINALEKMTGLTLFERSRGEVTLTSAGVAFRAYAQRIDYWYGAAEAMFGESGRLTLNRPVRVAADPVSAAYLLPEALATVLAAQPGTGFTVDGVGAAAEGELPMQESDLTVTVSPSPETMDFAGERLLAGVMEAVVIASPRNRFLRDAAVAETDGPDAVKPFSTIAGIHVSNRFAIWSQYRPFMTADLLGRIALASSSIEAVKSVVLRSSDVVGIVPAPSVRAEIERGGLLLMPVSLPDFTFDIHVRPSADFAGKTVCRLLQDALRAAARTGAGAGRKNAFPGG